MRKSIEEIEEVENYAKQYFIDNGYGKKASESGGVMVSVYFSQGYDLKKCFKKGIDYAREIQNR